MIQRRRYAAEPDALPDFPAPGPPTPLAWPQIIGTFTTAVMGAVGIMTILGTLTLDPIRTFESDTKEHLREIDVRMAPLLTLAAQIKSDDAAFARLQAEVDAKLDTSAHVAYLQSTAKEIDDNKNSALRTNEEISHQVHDLESKIVSRDENTEHWIDINARITNLENRLNALSLSIDTTKDRALIPPVTTEPR